jgi:CHAT domain-containing protein
VPDPEYANKFYTALSEHLKVSKLLEYGHLTRCNGYFLVYGTQLAMQPIISKEIGLTLPIIHSFYEPLKAKELKRVFVWQGYTQLAELHRIGVEEVFKSFNVEVIWLTCFDSNKEEFLEHYSGEDYDIFWILGHGEFMHHESHNSYIDLGNEIKVTITEVSSIQFQSTERRLLILDACDGATTSLANNPAAIGLGSSMVSAHQSLISHGWPVENVSSMILGIILSIFLGQGYTYSEAHQKTISKFYEGKDNVLELFRQFNINEDIIERIVNKDFDYSNFYYWGSLVHVI